MWPSAILGVLGLLVRGSPSFGLSTLSTVGAPSRGRDSRLRSRLLIQRIRVGTTVGRVVRHARGRGSGGLLLAPGHVVAVHVLVGVRRRGRGRLLNGLEFQDYPPDMRKKYPTTCRTIVFSAQCMLLCKT